MFEYSNNYGTLKLTQFGKKEIREYSIIFKEEFQYNIEKNFNANNVYALAIPFVGVIEISNNNEKAFCFGKYFKNTQNNIEESLEITVLYDDGKVDKLNFNSKCGICVGSGSLNGKSLTFDYKPKVKSESVLLLENQLNAYENNYEENSEFLNFLNDINELQLKSLSEKKFENNKISKRGIYGR